MLSYSTMGSAKHEEVTKVQDATKIVKENNPNLLVDGELQLDAALVESVAKLLQRQSARDQRLQDRPTPSSSLQSKQETSATSLCRDWQRLKLMDL